ncbi:MAG TPA: ribosome maturation factor RimM [Bryobacteraceae bacterium]|nr:ribosome maturation factor RimM [Bryobacteraceae bacterium]
MNPRLVSIGRLLRARGNRGELVGELDSREPGREERLQEVTLELGDRRKAVRVQEVWRNPAIYDGRPVFKFEGIDSISDAEVWQGAGILVPAEDVAPTPEGEYSHADLIGSRVVSLKKGEPEADELVGVVEGIEEFGGPPLLRVRAADGREILIPFARSICKRVDVASKTIGVELPEGLLDLQ